MLNVAHLDNNFPTNIYTSDASQTPPFHLISAHDYNLVYLLRGLGIYPNELINYSASLSFERRTRSQTNYVTVSQMRFSYLDPIIFINACVDHIYITHKYLLFLMLYLWLLWQYYFWNFEKGMDFFFLTFRNNILIHFYTF